MRLLRFIISTLALAGALVLLIVGCGAFLLLRLFGRPATRPTLYRGGPRNPPRPVGSRRDDVIDVVTTPVKD